MIRLAILKPRDPAGDAVRLIADDAAIFDVVLEDSSKSPSKSLARDVATAAPEIILLDVADWPATRDIVLQIKGASRNAAIIGYRGICTAEEEAEMEQAGVATLLPAPFSAPELDAATHIALQGRRPMDHPNILAFLPSKAGSGCSTVALNTAAVLANELGLRTLLIEGDRRSGVVGMVLGIDDKGGLPAILAQSSKLTPVEWRQHLASIGKLDMLLANPLKPGAQPTWATYFQILDFVKNLYDFILVDLPELINPATVELARAARSVFVVCEPELASLKLVGVRKGELEAAGVRSDTICVLGNRWDGRRLTKDALEKTTQVPMYAAMPNDYLNVKNAVMESRLVAKDSAFGRACEELARRVSSMPAPQEGRVSSLRKLFGKK